MFLNSVNVENATVSNIDNGIGIKANATNGTATINNTNVENTADKAIDATGDDVELDNVDVDGVDDAIVVNAENNADINNVTVTGGNGTAIDVNANSTSIDGVELIDRDGTGIKTNTSNTTARDITVSGGEMDPVNDLYDVPEDTPEENLDKPTIAPDFKPRSDDDSVRVGSVTITVTVPGNMELTVIFNNMTETGNHSVTFTVNLTAGVYNISAIVNGLSYNSTFTVSEYSFADLQKLINEAAQTGEPVVLEHDYVYTPGDEPIQVPANVVIDGNGHTIDANNQTSIFNITADNVVIEDMDLTNAKDGAISANGNNITISGVDISNTTGTAISIIGDNTTVSDVTIEDNDGVGIDIDGNGATVEDVELDNITQTAIAIIVYYLKFINFNRQIINHVN